MLSDFSFTKASRLLKPQEFREVFASRPMRSPQQGISIWGGRQKTVGPARLGMTVSKKAVPKAVARNHLRRLIRESFRLHQHDLAGFNLVVQIHRGHSQITVAALNQQWQQFLARHNKH